MGFMNVMKLHSVYLAEATLDVQRVVSNHTFLSPTIARTGSSDFGGRNQTMYP